MSGVRVGLVAVSHARIPWLDFLAAATGLHTARLSVASSASFRQIRGSVHPIGSCSSFPFPHPGTLRTKRKDQQFEQKKKRRARAVPSILTRSQREVCQSLTRKYIGATTINS